MIFQLTAELESPVSLNSEADLHLDGLLYSIHYRGVYLTRADPAEAIQDAPLPVARFRRGDGWLWAATACRLAEEANWEPERFTKRKDPGDLFYLQANHDPGTGPGRNYLARHMTVATPTISWMFAEIGPGGARKVKRLVRGIDSVGRLRRQGFGRVSRWHLEPIDADPLTTLVSDGKAQRYLPRSWCEWAEDTDRGPCLPPYWHSARTVDRVKPGWRCQLVDGITCH